MRLGLFIFAFTFTQLVPHCATPPAAVPQNSSAVANINAGTAKKDEATGEKLQEIRDSVEGIKAGAKAAAPGPAVDAINREAEHIADVTGKEPSKEGAAASLERVNLVLAGKVTEAEVKYTHAHDQNILLTKQITDANAAIEKAKADFKAEQEASAAERTRLENEAHAKDMGLITKSVVGVGVTCLLGGIALGVFLFWSGTATPKGLGAAGMLAVSGVGCFALSRFLAHPWIPYVVGGIIVLVVLVAFVMFIKTHYDLHSAKQAAQDGFNRVVSGTGQAIAKLRNEMPAAKERITEIFDQHIDADHQTAIGDAAHDAIKP